MYEAFYGLKTKPFSILPDPEFLYLGKKHRVALTLLEYALMNNAGFCVISGEIGAGKTTLLRKLLASIEENSSEDITIGMITNTHQSFGELLDWVLAAFGIHQPGLSKVEMHQRLVDFLIEQYASNQTTLLIVDEAQNMPVAALEELRMLSNINSEKDLVLQVILAGQPELKNLLRKPELTQFAQRISVDFHLDALNSIETCHYIQHRLVTAGATDNIFTPEACRLIYGYSGGVPRLINLLCDTALVYGFADQKKTIDVDLVQEMIDERMEHSILPMINIEKNQNIINTDNDDFPWISPDGGTAGLKPAAEIKTVEKAAYRKEPATEDIAQAVGVSQQTAVITTKAAKTIASVAEYKPSKKITPVVEIPADAYITERRNSVSQKITPVVDIPTESYGVNKHRNNSLENDRQPSNHGGTGRRAHNQAADTVRTCADDRAEKSQFGNRMIMLALFILALFLSLTSVSFNDDAPVSSTLDHEMAEVDTIKQDLMRMQQQSEAIQREHDAAKAALEATIKADEELVKAQLLEEKILREEREQLELERQEIELQQQLLEEQRQMLVQDLERLAKEKAQTPVSQ